MILTLKYDATCRNCYRRIPAGARAHWYRTSRAVYCLSHQTDEHNIPAPPPPAELPAQPPTPPPPGIAAACPDRPVVNSSNTPPPAPRPQVQPVAAALAAAGIPTAAYTIRPSRPVNLTPARRTAGAPRTAEAYNADPIASALDRLFA